MPLHPCSHKKCPSSFNALDAAALPKSPLSLISWYFCHCLAVNFNFNLSIFA
jgi:hypothetical protein